MRCVSKTAIAAAAKKCRKLRHVKDVGTQGAIFECIINETADAGCDDGLSHTRQDRVAMRKAAAVVHRSNRFEAGAPKFYPGGRSTARRADRSFMGISLRRRRRRKRR